jgi:hypothetical protein
MKGLKVQCPGCKKVFHETTEKYDPDVRPNGAMVRLLEPWKGWGWAAFDAEGLAASTTLCSEMLCPGCTAPLAPSGRLTVIPKTPQTNEEVTELVTELYNEAKEDKKKIQEATKLNDQVDAKVTHTEEPSTMECVKCHKVKHVNDFATPDECIECFEGVPVPAPKQKTKKKANTLKKKAKKRK